MNRKVEEDGALLEETADSRRTDFRISLRIAIVKNAMIAYDHLNAGAWR